jgi:hypothetical protein
MDLVARKGQNPFTSLTSKRMVMEGQLKVVQFVNLCITDADVLSVVLRQLLLQDHQDAPTTPSEPSDQAEQPEATNELR